MNSSGTMGPLKFDSVVSQGTPAITSVREVRPEFQTGDLVACTVPDLNYFSAAGRVIAIRSNHHVTDEYEEYIVAMSPTVLGVYHAEQLVLLAPAQAQECRR